jgi:hypothetical protein
VKGNGKAHGSVCINSLGTNCNYSRLRKRNGVQVAPLVKALRYKLEGRGFDSQWGQ